MVEMIGFIISLLALLYIFTRQSVPIQRPPPSQVSVQEEELGEEDLLSKFIKAVEKEAAAREGGQRRSQRPPSPPPAPVPVITKQPKLPKPPKKPLHRPLEDYRLASAIEERHVKSTLEERHLRSRFNHLEEEKVHELSRVHKAMQRLSSRRDLLIYYEIMHPPKSMR